MYVHIQNLHIYIYMYIIYNQHIKIYTYFCILFSSIMSSYDSSTFIGCNFLTKAPCLVASSTIRSSLSSLASCVFNSWITSLNLAVWRDPRSFADPDSKNGNFHLRFLVVDTLKEYGALIDLDPETRFFGAIFYKDSHDLNHRPSVEVGGCTPDLLTASQYF